MPICAAMTKPGTSRDDHVAVQVHADIDVALHDGVVGRGVDPAASLPMKEGLKRTSGQWKCSLPMVMTCLSGNS